MTTDESPLLRQHQAAARADIRRIELADRFRLLNALSDASMHFSKEDFADVERLLRGSVQLKAPGADVVREALDRLKYSIDTRLNDVLCEMKPGYDDSMVGFNEAWDVVRKAFADRLAALANRAAIVEALDAAVSIIMANEPGDSRAVSNIAVALAAVACGDTSEPVMKVIREFRALSGEDVVRDSTETMEQLFTQTVTAERDQWKARALKAEAALADRAAIVEALEPFANATIGWVESSFDEHREITLVCDDVNMGGIDVSAFFRAARVLATLKSQAERCSDE